MALLRLIADILLYLALALLVYWYFTEDMTALLIAIASGIGSFLLFVITSDIKQSRRQPNQGNTADLIWDLWFYTDLLELPFRLIGWLLSKLWHIFD